MTQILLVVHIGVWHDINSLSNYRKLVDWPHIPRQGEHVNVGGNLYTGVDRVKYRTDGRPEIHFVRFPVLDGLDDWRTLVAELTADGWSGVTAWDDEDLDKIDLGPNPDRA